MFDDLAPFIFGIAIGVTVTLVALKTGSVLAWG